MLTPEEQAQLDELELRRLESRRNAAMQAQQAAGPSGPQLEEMPERPEESGWEDFGEGLGVSFLDTYYGIKDLVTDLDDEDRARLKDWKDDAAQSGWGTGGRVVGEMAQLAVPGGAGLKAARALSAAGKMAKTAKALPLASDIAGSAGLGYVQLPDDAASRGQEAWQGGLAGLGGGLAGGLAKKMFMGAKGTPAAARIRDLGGKLTLGQTVPAWGFVEDLTTVLPFASRAIRGLREKSKESLHKLTLKEAASPTVKSLDDIGKGIKAIDEVEYLVPKKMGQDGVAELKEGFNAAYDNVWGNAGKLKRGTIQKVDKALKEGIRDLGPTEAMQLRKALKDLNKLKTSKNVTAMDLDRILRKQIKYTKDSGVADSVVRSARKKLRRGLSDDKQDMLRLIDDKWPSYKAVENAAGGQSATMSVKNYGSPGIFSPEEGLGGARMAAKKAARGRGEYPMRGTLSDQVSVQTDMPSILGTLGIRKRQALPSIPGLRTLNQQFAGNYSYQKYLRKKTQEEWAKRLRYYGTGARAGGAYEGDF